MKYLGFLLLVWLIVVSCHDGCEPEETRCSNNIVQVCASDEDWSNTQNCNNVQPGEWICCEWASVINDEEVAGCVQLGECE